MSLFDQPQEQLNPDIFDENENIREWHRLYFLDEITKFMAPGSVMGVYLLGSMAGRQYNEYSDIDINIVLNRNIDLEMLKERVKAQNGKLLPGTEHPVNYHLQGFTEAKYSDHAEYAVYDLSRNVWAVPPKKYMDIRNPSIEFQGELGYATLYSKILSYKHNEEELKELLEKERKQVYSFGWGTPRESQKNILYKFIEELTKK